MKALSVRPAIGWAALLALFSIVVHPGYTTAARDQIFYIANILKELDPSLYTRDFMALYNPGRYALLNKLVIWTIHGTGLDLYGTLFLLSFLFRFTFFISMLLLIRRITQDEMFSYLATLLFLSSFLLYGTATFTFETELLPRSAALACALLFLACDFYDRQLLSLPCLLAAIAIHPITAIPFVAYFYLSAFHRKSIFSWSLRLVPLLGMAFLYQRSPAQNDMVWNTRLNPAWEAIVRPRSPTTWVSHWRPGGYIHLAASFLMLAIGWPRRDAPCRAYGWKLLLFVVIGLAGAFVTLVGLDLLGYMFFAWMQPARYLIGLKFISRIALAYWIYRELKAREQPFLMEWAMVMTLAAFAIEERMIWIGFPIVALRWALKDRFTFPMMLVLLLCSVLGAGLKFRDHSQLLMPFLIIFLGSWCYLRWGRDTLTLRHAAALLCCAMFARLPWFHYKPWFYERPDLIRLCEWIQKNTSKVDLFLVDPFSSLHVPVRLMAQRNVFVSEKEGSEGLLSESFAYEWQKRMRAASQRPTSSFTRHERINYVIMSARTSDIGRGVYADDNWYIYKIQ